MFQISGALDSRKRGAGSLRYGDGFAAAPSDRAQGSMKDAAVSK